MAADGARARVMARISKRMPQGRDAERAKAVDARLAAKKRNLIPARGDGDLEHRIALFAKLMDGVGGTVERVPSTDEIPQAVARYLRGNNLPAKVRRGEDPLLSKLPWHRARTLDVEEGRAIDADKASITRAFAAVAESATVIQLSGPDNPTTLNFLPEAHIAVVMADDVVGNYEEAWTRLRKP